MVNIDTHDLVDMIHSRKTSDVADWLKTYPKIEVVSRDGSISYKTAIEAAFPNAIQVSDRFHIIKNFADSFSTFIKSYFKPRVVVEESGKIKECNDETTIVLAEMARSRLLTLRDKYDGVTDLINSGKSKSFACKELHLDIRVFNRLCAMTDLERENRFGGVAIQKQISALQRKQEKIDTVKSLFKADLKKTRIAKELGLDLKTVSKYLTIENAEVSHLSRVKHQSIVDPFKNDIETALKSGLTTKMIMNLIQAKGYEGSSRTLRIFISEWKSGHAQELLAEAGSQKIQWVDRKTLLELCYKRADEIHGLTKAVLKKVFKRYPTFKKIYDLMISFKKIFKKKEHWNLEKWLNETEQLDVVGLKSFVAGVRRDLTAVKNAIRFQYNNGLAEGHINKIKVIKRIMYGKCSFETLRKKILGLGANRNLN